jgi:ATP-binding cassette subfamily F protein 3
LLDEPTNHLDVESVMALTGALEEFEGAVLIVTHSEEILRRVATRLVVFQGDAPFVFEGTYDEFLDSIGWEGEEETAPRKASSKRAKGGASAGDPKRQKAELLQERSRVLTPIRDTVSRLELTIGTLESSVAELEKKIAGASKSGDGPLIQKASQELAQARSDLQRAMKEWEEAEQKRLTAEADFEKKLGKL